MKARLVRKMKMYHYIDVANVMHSIGYRWNPPSSRPTNVEKMVEGIPRCDLERILSALQRSGEKPLRRGAGQSGAFAALAMLWGAI